ncbi:MAG: serine/threonine-protein kinase [Ignavibacteriales bacterium]|nr:serine/threonine-protein kinase [Ignavibacteriales bacterium]
MIGQTISHYKILEKLGEGGMGVVYKAQDTTLDRLVALKFLPPHVSSSSDDKVRFTQEAKSAAALSHPNICTIYGVEEHDAQYFIVMEYVEGRTLKEMKNNMPLKQAIDIGIQLSDGLAAAHEKGIVHRDIKPENIMVRKDGRVQIMDFGLAKLKGASRLTKEGSTVGTAGYMSPEQVQGLETDHRTDIFSLGVVLYELFSGQSPFKAAHETAIAYEIVNVDPEPISSIRGEIDPQIDAIVLEALQKEPSERYQSVAEIAKELRRFKRESSRTRVSRVTAARHVPKMSEDQPPKVFLGLRSRELLFAAAAGFFLVIALVFAIIHFLDTPVEVRSFRSTILPPDKATLINTVNGSHIALSPDGRMLAFVARDSIGKTLLWVRSLSALSGQPLSGTDGAEYPFWSPDNRHVGFFAGGKLRKIETSGGPPQTICEALAGRGGSWNQDGVIVFTSGTSRPLSRVSAAGGVATIITTLDTSRSERGHRWPHFLPDGKHILFLSRTAPSGSSETDAIHVASLDSTEESKLLFHASSNVAYAGGHLLYLREQSLMAQPFDAARLQLTGDAFPIAEQIQFVAIASSAVFSVSQNGVLVYQVGGVQAGTQFTWFDRKGKPLGSIRKPGSYFRFRLSPDNRRVAVEVVEPQSNTGFDIWLVDFARDIWTRFTFNPAIDRDPVWSPDGSRIVFDSFRKGSADLYQRISSGAVNEEVLFESMNNKYPTDWSMDGKYLVYTEVSAGETRPDLWVLPHTGDRKPKIFLQTEFSERRGVFSSDGKWIAYESDESGRFQIYVRPFPEPGAPTQVSTAGGSWPRWRRDGKEIFFITDNNAVMAAEVRMSRSAIEVGAVRQLFVVNAFRGANFNVNGYDVTADGQRFLVNTIVGETAQSPPITLVLNWQADVKKK